MKPVIIIMALLSILLAACGGDSAPDTPNPEDAVQEAVDAVLNADFDAYRALLCPDLQEDYGNLLDGGNALPVLDDYDTSDLSYDVVILEETTATNAAGDEVVDAEVTISGTLSYEFFDTTVEVDAAEALDDPILTYQQNDNWQVCTLDLFDLVTVE